LETYPTLRRTKSILHWLNLVKSQLFDAKKTRHFSRPNHVKSPLFIQNSLLITVTPLKAMASPGVIISGAVDHYGLLGLRRFTHDATEIKAAYQAARHVAQARIGCGL
jgi:hypothetical protein